MKTLLIMRHAESDPAESGLEDHDRSINHQGRLDATRIGQLLVAEGLRPERIFASTAGFWRRATIRFSCRWAI